ncbi:MAG: hypothetical protein WA056_02220 [Gallionella sp.]
MGKDYRDLSIEQKENRLSINKKWRQSKARISVWVNANEHKKILDFSKENNLKVADVIRNGISTYLSGEHQPSNPSIEKHDPFSIALSEEEFKALQVCADTMNMSVKDLLNTVAQQFVPADSVPEELKLDF